MTKLLTNFCSFFLFLAVNGQTPSDFFFTKPIPENTKSINKTPTKFIGEWQSNKDTLRTLFFTENKIYSQYKHVMILSGKEFESSGYSLKNNFVYGFSKSDSLPAIVKNDTVIFCYISEHEIINYVKETENEFVVELKDGLLLSQKEDSFYRYTFIQIKKDELVLSEVDHENKTKEIVKASNPKIELNSNQEPIRYLAELNKKDLEKFISSGYFNDVQRCTRINAN